MPFSNPVVGGTTLVRDSIHSPLFVHNSTGWSINQDGSAEFNNALIRGGVIVGNGTTNTIIIDSNTDSILVYNSTGKLIASISPAGGIDGSGNVFQPGIVSMDPTATAERIEMAGNLLRLWNGDVNELGAFQIQVTPASAGPSANQPSGRIIGPFNSSLTPELEFVGSDTTGTKDPYLRISKFNGSTDLNVLLAGILKYNDPAGSISTAEKWHFIGTAGEPTFASVNWANHGAPWGNLAFQKTPLGKVAFSGLIDWTAAATPAPVAIFTLPTGYRPNRQLHIAALSSPGAAVNPTTENLEITTAGVVSISNFAAGPNTPLSFDGVEFYLNVA